MDMDQIGALIVVVWWLMGAAFFHLYGLLDRRIGIFYTILYFLLYPIITDIITKKLFSIEYHGEDLTENDTWDIRFVNKAFKRAFKHNTSTEQNLIDVIMSHMYPS